MVAIPVEGLEPKKVIQEILETVKEQLNPSDFMMTDSLRFRYDSMIRGLAAKLKEEKILSGHSELKGKLWGLTKYFPNEIIKEDKQEAKLF